MHVCSYLTVALQVMHMCVDVLVIYVDASRLIRISMQRKHVITHKYVNKALTQCSNSLFKPQLCDKVA